MRLKSRFSIALTLVLSCLLLVCFSSANATEVWLEEFNGTTIAGTPYGLTYVSTPTGKGAKFTRTTESRVQYPYSAGMPKSGTLEARLKIDSAYQYRNYALSTTESCALVFTTDVGGGDVTYPGSAWFHVCNNGDIYLTVATTKYGSSPAQQLVAKATAFRFGAWHTVSFSFGTGGQAIAVNGKVVAENARNTQILGAGGDHSSPIDTPTLGESVPGFWSNNQWDGGFEGVVDTFRVSDVSQDWKLGKTTDPNDILGEFIDLNKSTIDYANDTIVLTFTKPLSVLSNPGSPRPPILSDYFDKVQLKIGGTIRHTWEFADIATPLLNSPSNSIKWASLNLKKYPNQLIELQFSYKPSEAAGWLLRASLQGVYDKVRNVAGNAIVNSRTVAQTKPTANIVCTNKQGVKTPCNNFFNSTESGKPSNALNTNNIAVFRNTLSHRLIDFDKAVGTPINPAWEKSVYGAKASLGVPGDNGRIPLLLIHGWQGGSFLDTELRNPAKLGQWAYSELQYWRNFLDYYLATPALQSKYHVYLYHYPTYKHISYNGLVLKNMLNELAAKKPASDLNVAMQTGGKGVVVLAHSMGGLVTRSAIEEYHAFGGSGGKLRRLIMLDTPHHGSPGANPDFLGDIVKDLYTQGSADIQWDNFDGLYTSAEVDSRNAARWDARNTDSTTGMNSESFDKAYRKACTSDICPETTQNPWLAWLNAGFVPLMDTYSSKYLLYAGWIINAQGIDALGAVIKNGLMNVSDKSLRDAADIPSGGAAPVSSALWYSISPHSAKYPFPLYGSVNESPFYTYCVKKPDWDASQWFGGDSSAVKIQEYNYTENVCGNSILISKSATLSTPNPHHDLGFQMRIFWDYDHETMVNGAYWGEGVFKQAGGWDKYIDKPPYIINGDTSGDSGFRNITNKKTSPVTLARDNYIAKAQGYRQNNVNLTWTFNSPANYNPLLLEPLFNVLERDLVRTNNEGFIVP